MYCFVRHLKFDNLLFLSNSENEGFTSSPMIVKSTVKQCLGNLCYMDSMPTIKLIQEGDQKNQRGWSYALVSLSCFLICNNKKIVF